MYSKGRFLFTNIAGMSFANNKVYINYTILRKILCRAMKYENYYIYMDRPTQAVCINVL